MTTPENTEAMQPDLVRPGEVLTDDDIYIAWPRGPFVDRTEAKEFARTLERRILSKLAKQEPSIVQQK